MSVTDFKSFPGVPIVGEPKIHEWRPIVSFECSCGKGRPLLISSTDQAVKCDGCGNYFALHAVQFDSLSGDGAMIALKQIQKPSTRVN